MEFERGEVDKQKDRNVVRPCLIENGIAQRIVNL